MTTYTKDYNGASPSKGDLESVSIVVNGETVAKLDQFTLIRLALDLMHNTKIREGVELHESMITWVDEK